MVPAPRSAGIPNLPAAKAVDVADMRKKLARATSVPEARLLVDMFLAQWGFTAGKLPDAEMELPPSITLNGGVQDDDHGVGVVEMLLGEGTEEVRTPSEESAQSQGVSNSSPTISDTPLTPSSFSAAKMVASPGGHGRNMRVDVKRSVAGNNGSGSPSASGNSSVGHGQMQHHRYGNASPVVVS
jgi:hypothetical protein